jgi:hypothetical protein
VGDTVGARCGDAPSAPHGPGWWWGGPQGQAKAVEAAAGVLVVLVVGVVAVLVAERTSDRL